jgi:hypothetical protein
MVNHYLLFRVRVISAGIVMECLFMLSWGLNKGISKTKMAEPNPLCHPKIRFGIYKCAKTMFGAA